MKASMVYLAGPIHGMSDEDALKIIRAENLTMSHRQGGKGHQ